MADNIRTLLRMFKTYGRMDILWFLRDTRYCLLQMASDLVSAAASSAGVFILARKFNGFGNMSEGQILFMLAYAMLIDGLYMLFFGSSNTGQISRVIGRGQLDHNMIQPVPLLTQLLTEGFSPISCTSIFFFGVGLAAYALNQLAFPVTFGWLLALAASLFASLTVMLAVIYILSCLAFLAPAAAEEIASTTKGMFSSLQVYPLSGVAPLWKTVFCTLVPVGLAAWFPSMTLMGIDAGSPDIVFFPPLTGAVAAVLVLAATIIFRKGMKHYAISGSPRYTGFGHR